MKCQSHLIQRFNNAEITITDARPRSSLRSTRSCHKTRGANKSKRTSRERSEGNLHRSREMKNFALSRRVKSFESFARPRSIDFLDLTKLIRDEFHRLKVWGSSSSDGHTSYAQDKTNFLSLIPLWKLSKTLPSRCLCPRHVPVEFSCFPLVSFFTSLLPPVTLQFLNFPRGTRTRGWSCRCERWNNFVGDYDDTIYWSRVANVKTYLKIGTLRFHTGYFTFGYWFNSFSIWIAAAFAIIRLPTCNTMNFTWFEFLSSKLLWYKYVSTILLFSQL